LQNTIKSIKKKFQFGPTLGPAANFACWAVTFFSMVKLHPGWNRFSCWHLMRWNMFWHYTDSFDKSMGRFLHINHHYIGSRHTSERCMQKLFKKISVMHGRMF